MYEHGALHSVWSSVHTVVLIRVHHTPFVTMVFVDGRSKSYEDALREGSSYVNGGGKLEVHEAIGAICSTAKVNRPSILCTVHRPDCRPVLSFLSHAGGARSETTARSPRISRTCTQSSADLIDGRSVRLVVSLGMCSSALNSVLHLRLPTCGLN